MLGSMNSMLAIDFSIYHHGCPACQSTEKFPTVDMKILSSNPYGQNKASVLQYADSAKEDDVTHFLSYWRDHSSVTKFSVAERVGKGVVFNVSLKSRGGWVTKAILDNDAVFPGPVSVLKGLEYWSVLVGEGNKSSLFSQLDEVGVVKINRIEKLDLMGILSPQSSAVSDLSPKQASVLKTAFEKGYFDSPRRVSSRELASQVGVAQSTLLEHLRKAESKIMRNVFYPFQRQS